MRLLVDLRFLLSCQLYSAGIPVLCRPPAAWTKPILILVQLTARCTQKFVWRQNTSATFWGSRRFIIVFWFDFVVKRHRTTVKNREFSKTDRIMCLLAFRRSPFKLAINVPGVLLAVPLMEKHSTVGTENMLGRFVDSVRPALHIYRCFLLFHSTNGNSCCRGNTSSLWRIWGKEKPKEWHPAVFWAVVCGLRELPVTMGRRFTGHAGLCRKPLSWQTIYLAVCRRACGRWNLWYLLAHKLWFRRQGSDCFVCVCVFAVL